MHFELRKFCVTLLINSLLCSAFEGSKTQNTTELEELIIDYPDEDLHSEGNSCSIDQFVNDFNVTSLLPDDYKFVTKDEELNRIVPHINQTIERIERLMNWTQKLYNNNELVRGIKLIGSRIFDILYESDLPPKCLASIFQVINGIRNGKHWALKCDYYVIYKICVNFYLILILFFLNIFIDFQINLKILCAYGLLY
jgi:hypothetical protein